jgi:hypothetical protein
MSHLVATGVLTQGGVGRTVRSRVHAPCGEVTLAGLDADVAAFEAIVDPYPLTPVGEVEALRADRRTYRLADRRLEPRTGRTITGHPPGPDCRILATHRCGQPIPDGWKAPPPPRRPPPPPLDY